MARIALGEATGHHSVPHTWSPSKPPGIVDGAADRLGPAKEIAQIGAAIGREFSHALLTAVVQKSEPELRSGLDRLIQAGLLFRQGVPPHASYLFKHALVQDAAYGTLLRERRRALESQFAEIVENQPELLARGPYLS
jgi:predicted ATPase